MHPQSHEHTLHQSLFMQFMEQKWHQQSLNFSFLFDRSSTHKHDAGGQTFFVSMHKIELLDGDVPYFCIWQLEQVKHQVFSFFCHLRERMVYSKQIL